MRTFVAGLDFRTLPARVPQCLCHWHRQLESVVWDGGLRLVGPGVELQGDGVEGKVPMDEGLMTY